MQKVSLNAKQVGRLKAKMKRASTPRDEAAFLRFIIKKYEAAKKARLAGKARPKGGGWTFTWDGFSWSYRFG